MYPWTVSIDFFNRATDERGKSVRLVKRVIKRSMVPSNQSEKKKKEISHFEQGLFSIFTTVQKQKKLYRVNNSRVLDHPLSGISIYFFLIVERKENSFQNEVLHKLSNSFTDLFTTTYHEKIQILSLRQ